MSTTCDLERELLERAKEVLGAESFTETVETALRETVARAEASVVWNRLSGSGLSWERVDDLLEFRRRYGGRTL